jgi:hypothetical protein
MGVGLQLITDLAQLKCGGYIRQAASIVEIGAQQRSNHFLGSVDDLNELY